MLSYMAGDWQGRLDLHQGPLASEASVLLAELRPNYWCFPSVPTGGLRDFNPALSPDQLEKRKSGAPGLDSNGPPPAH